MMTPNINRFYSLFAFLLALFCASSATAATALNISQNPLFLAQNAAPLIMLNLSKDQQLYIKAYTDFSDIDGDGVPDTTYKNAIKYYGYFDSRKCYAYDTTASRFTPKAEMPSGYDYCDTVTGGPLWSGNFLNWIAMARMDEVRKLLFGGLRSTDTATTTVLERVYLPHDAHSWAKYYGASAAERSELLKLTPFTSSDATGGISFCNTTASGSTAQSQTVTDPPLIRVAKGNFSLWAANERWQCRWREEKDASNSNDPTKSGLSAQSRNPYLASDALGEKNYIARVEACVTGLLGTENCKQYPNGNYKPYGLLQQYGDDDIVSFGLFTGSYVKNISGGVLRKNVSSFTDEVNVATDGTFKSAPSTGGIVNTLNKMRIYGYYYGDGTYLGSTGDNCTYQLTSIVEGNCTSWGNPMSEIYLESLRYLAGKTPTAAFNTDDTTRLPGLTTSTWVDPLNSNNFCASMNVINLNASVSSYDDNQLAGISDLGASGTANSWTKTVGDMESITGGSYFVGRNGTDNNEFCTPKTVVSLGDVVGICPEAPTLSGSYLMAGLAYYAHTNNIRPIKTLDPKDLENKVNTYGISLAPAVPKIVVPVPGSTTNKTITILPAYRLTKSGGDGGGTLMDFRVITPQQVTGSVGTGKFYVNWEDSEQGGDFDQDVWGTIEYSVTPTTIKVTTNIIANSTANAQGFGYVISGTTADGVHFHSGIFNFKFVDTTGVTDCTIPCNQGDAASTASYTIGTTSAGFLKDPLYYAAKWGGFKDTDKNGIITKQSQWDARNNTTGFGGSDNVPDNYFLVTNPAQLASSLNSAINNIMQQTGSASSVSLSSSSIQAGSALFEASFESGFWVGHLKQSTLALSSTGQVTVTPTPASDAGPKLKAQATRNILTTNINTAQGAAFEWDTTSSTTSIGTTSQTALQGSDSATIGQERLNYLRGDTTKEISNTLGAYRIREQGNVLGDIINSTPLYVGASNFGYASLATNATLTAGPAPEYKTYAQFATATGARAPVVYVGANDGMLHGFNTSDSSEAVAYVPSFIYPDLINLTSPTYTHEYFVDLSPTYGDAYGSFPTCVSSPFGAASAPAPASPCWRTLLIGGLRGGGVGYFALDITNPTTFSESAPAKTVLWEFPRRTVPVGSTDTASTDVADLGSSFSEVSIAKMHTASGTRWAAILGNGYGSPNGHAVLFIVDAVTGALIRKIDTGVAGDNGLSTPAVVDIDGDMIADYVYAGDLKGNMWKFDVRDNDETKWGSFYGTSSAPAPLFKAVDGSAKLQPITERPTVGWHPNGKAAGQMVYFGTGKYFEVNDNIAKSTPVHSFYGVWDQNGTGGGAGAPVARADLFPQTISLVTGSTNYRTATATTFKWRQSAGGTCGSAATQDCLGWREDFITTGEMSVTDPVLRGGRIAYTTLIPDGRACGFGGDGWLMEVDYATGGTLSFVPFDINGDGLFNQNDQPLDSSGTRKQLAGIKSTVGVPSAPTFVQSGPQSDVPIIQGSTGAQQSVTSNSGRTGRRGWRQVK